MQQRTSELGGAEGGGTAVGHKGEAEVDETVAAVPVIPGQAALPTSAPAAADTAGPVPASLQHTLADKDAQISRLTKQLAHYRSWLSSVHARVLHMNPQAVQNAKRLYIGNLPPNVTVDEITAFLNNLMAQTGAQVGPEPAVLQCHHTQERKFAFVEFRSVEEASNAMGLDGVAWRDCHLKIRRPSNYDLATSLMLGPVTPDPTMDISCLNLASKQESPNKLFVGGLPCEWPEQAVRMILEPWGEIKAFNLVMDKATGNSKGYAFCEFADDAITDKAIAGLNGQRAGTKTLTVKRAAEGARSTAPGSGPASGNLSQRGSGMRTSVDEMPGMLESGKEAAAAGLANLAIAQQQGYGSGGFGIKIGGTPSAPAPGPAYAMMPYVATGRGMPGGPGAPRGMPVVDPAGGMQRMPVGAYQQPQGPYGVTHTMQLHPRAMGGMMHAAGMMMHTASPVYTPMLPGQDAYGVAPPSAPPHMGPGPRPRSMHAVGPGPYASTHLGWSAGAGGPSSDPEEVYRSGPPTN